MTNNIKYNGVDDDKHRLAYLKKNGVQVYGATVAGAGEAKGGAGILGIPFGPDRGMELELRQLALPTFESYKNELVGRASILPRNGLLSYF
ncbi:hypothetical protein [Paenibacillus lautus]|uniref:hypothetical protein n=1 Tax=Paenibacillus lautus TaxID=1401 RepID=UPI003D2B5326